MFNPLQSVFGMNPGQNETDAPPGNLGGGAQMTGPCDAATQRPHSTKLANFRSNLPSLTPTLSEPLAQSIFDARCEISSYRCASPIRFYSTPKSACLALAGMSGWKNRSPALDYLVLNQPRNTDPHNEFSNARFIEPGLANIAYHPAVDDSRRLIFIGDGKRIKSYEWGTTTELYRDPLPIHTLNSGHAEGPITVLSNGTVSDYLEGAALAHPNGIPIIFTGSRKEEAIKTWDVRANACIYDLSTGNNAVQSLAWDADNNALYAATECLYLDRVGTSRGYREAVTPQGQTHDPRRFRCWPKAAHHKEDYFGYMFDAGDHRVFRYTFKENPNTDVLPEYGNAILDKKPTSAHETMEALIHNMYINNFDNNSDPRKKKSVM
ncbi:unnamed protein product [Rhizoctonia solani]|uniref:Uncharacterized protein n=1 Tax=Rhizoctonia solani TaxID=456999 RepID=A0A8H2XCX4_9AGAM|nr:unnamed protein product [Rhizoctonia solani]